MIVINKKLNKYIWKWHYIAGVILSPLILLLLITGGIYLFKNIYEDYTYEEIKKVKIQDLKLSYEKQFLLIEEYASKKVSSIIISNNINETTVFEIDKWSKKRTIYLNPYTEEVQGDISIKNTFMQKVKKLHGELLLSSYGTKVIEFAASWMIILILSGMYLCLAKKGISLKKIFIIRCKSGKLAFYKDLHSVLALAMSVLLLLTLAGALPWTDIWGGLYKEVQKISNSGYPQNYSGKELKSENLYHLKRIKIDEMINIAKELKLKGSVSLILPKNKDSVFTIKNIAKNLYDQKVYHYNQYSKNIISSYTWNDVGLMMKSRQWLMRFHQGLLGTWNLVLMLFVCLLSFISILAGIYAYILNKNKKDLNIPDFKLDFGYGFIVLLLLLSILLPLFGLSILFIIVYESFKNLFFKKS